MHGADEDDADEDGAEEDGAEEDGADHADVRSFLVSTKITVCQTSDEVLQSSRKLLALAPARATSTMQRKTKADSENEYYESFMILKLIFSPTEERSLGCSNPNIFRAKATATRARRVDVALARNLKFI